MVNRRAGADTHEGFMTDIPQIGGWLAIIYLIIKDVAVPMVKKGLPAKQKQDEEKQKHEHLMEEKRLEAELGYQKQVADAVSEIKIYIGATNERLAHIEAGVNEVKEAVKTRRTKAQR
jgi:hypothetical protein